MAELKINEYKLKLQGIANLPKPLELSHCYNLEITNAEVRKTENIPNDDGTINQQFIIKISELSEVTIILDKEAIIAKKKGSQAKLMRYVLEQLADKLGYDREKFYQEQMSALIDEIKDKLN